MIARPRVQWLKSDKVVFLPGASTEGMSVPGGRWASLSGSRLLLQELPCPGQEKGEGGNGAMASLSSQTQAGACLTFTSYRETGRPKGCFEEHVSNENVNSITKEMATLHVGDNKQTVRP